MNQREKLIELLDIAFLNSDDNYGMPNTEQVADYLLDNGVALPCRCGECEHFYKYNCHSDNMRMNMCKLAVGTDGEDFYCPYGKRKGGDE